MTIRIKDENSGVKDWYLDLVYGDADEDPTSVSVVMKNIDTDEVIAYLITFETDGNVFAPGGAPDAIEADGYDLCGLTFNPDGKLVIE